ncbi:LOW QUALITY PROTEIN: cytochrome P450 4c3-like [Pogonomyrmex barbatus]|uniref:LOW QUALITY PROTEIN: cytochrome P450 4c3-like n=1 Tax=Pogonomyrmex barbatus TaxID=144034 RepID=A0A6I9W1L2_9HYME|nr:LOW QUALITY PROTEIN: cytochrome P450 4c3-like [Pogonomyrmex barbatus]
MIFIFEINKKDYYNLKRNLEFAFSLPGPPILLSIVHSLQIACSYKGATHRIRRKMIQPLLNIKFLSEYVTCFDNYSNQCADILEKVVDSPTFDLKPHIKQYAANIFLETMMGIEGTIRNENDELIYWQEILFKETYNRVTKPWLQFDWIFLTENGRQTHIAKRIVLDFIYNITSRKEMKHTALENNNENFEKPKAAFDHYLNRIQLHNVTNESCMVSDENFIDDVRSFYAAIQNTIMESISFTMLMLGMHTEVQEKLRQEISFTFGNEKVNAQGLISMQYLHMVIQETLRLFPITPTVSRQLTGDIKLESCTLPDGCYVLIPIFAIHRNSAYWPKPLEFIPERFSSENSSSRHRYTYIPFGTGPRDCIGQRYAFLAIATIITNLVRRFRFATSNSIEDIKLISDIVLRSQDVKLNISYA